jgi:hypothetical protein
MENLKSRKAWSEVLWTLNENIFNPRILYPAKLSFKIDGAIKVFHDKQKLKQYKTTKPPLQKILQGLLKQKMKAYKTMKEQAAPNHGRRKGKKVEGDINLTAQSNH